MKKRFVLLLTVVLISLLVSASVAASPVPPTPGEVRLDQADNGRRVTLRGNNVLVINLESNPSTGYSWQVQGIDRRLLRQVGQPEWVSRSTRLGAPATQVLRFAGVAEGRTTIDLAYRRPWDTASRARTFSVQVDVRRPAVNLASLGISPSLGETTTGESEPATASSTLSLPSSFSWCDSGGCPPVRDQGSCGSCWAFGTVGPLESRILIQDGVSRDLSEQYLVSCNTDGWGCNGGWWAHDYHEWKYPAGEPGPGAVYEADFPYTATDEACNPPHTHYETITDWVYIGNDSSIPATDAIKQAIYTYGPVAAAVCVDSNFQSYTGGVFNPRRPCNSINHAIVLVGWDDADGAWILRNSWGPNWGENGYMRIAYGASKVGYSANYVVYGGGGDPTPTPTPSPDPTPTPTPAPGDTMYVSAIDMWYSSVGRNYDVYTKVTIVDSGGSPVSNAAVSLQMTLPDGTPSTGSGTTASDGTITFSLRSKQTGTYTSEVTNVTHSSFTYDASANVETSETLAVP